jgi:two-component system cell cycle sensor histidine kinase/response regulator CckA
MSEENERLYEEAQRRLREVTTLYEASQACLSISDQKGLLTAIIEAAAQATDAILGSVMLVDEEQGEYVFGAHYALSQETIATIEAELHIPLGEGLVGAVVTTGQPLAVADATKDPRWIPMGTKELMRSFLGVPLVGRDGQPLGALTLSRPDVGAFDEDHVRLLSTFANQAAMAIENARLYEQAQQEITERKRAIEALRQSEERYRRLVELSFNAIAVHREGKIVYINAAGAELLGASNPEEIVGKPILDFVHPDSLEIAKARVLQTMEGRLAPLIEEKLIRLDGTSVDAEVLAIPITYQGQSAVQVVVRDVTERKQAEEAYRVLVEHSLQGLAILQGNSVVFANPAITEVLGYTIEELMSLSPEEMRAVVHSEDQAFVWGRYQDRLEGKPVPPRYEFRMMRKDGTVCWMEMFSSRIEYGGKPAIQAAFVDVTERKRAEEALTHERDLLHALMDNIPDTIYFKDAASRFTRINRAQAQVLGVAPEEVIGKTDFDFFTVEHARDAYADEQEIVKSGQPLIDKVEKIRRADGQFRWVSATKVPIMDREGRVTGIVGISRDITERRRAEDALRKSETLFHSLIESLPQNIFSKDLEGRFTFANQRYCMTEGKSLTDILGKTDFDLHPPELAKKYRENDHRVIETEQIFETVEEYQPMGGDRFYAQMIKTPVYDSKGQVTGILGIFWDITERKRAEEALRDSEERYRALYEDNPSMYFTVDTEGTVLSVNQFGAEQLGYTVEELIGKSVLDVFYRKDKEAVLEQFAACLQNPAQIAHWEFRKVRKDGSMLWVKETARAMRGADGDTVVLIVCEDITERKRLEEQLRQAQKMEAIGTLAGGIAHDFNNLLTPIGGFAELLMWKTPEDSQQHEYLRQIKVAAERAATLTHQLLTLARRVQVEVRPLSLNSVVHEVIGLLERTIDKAIAIEPHLADDLATVEGDAGQLHQVLLNLCLNARDAMPDGGQLIIETQNMTLSKAEARTVLDLDAGQYVLLRVTDTGIGMDAEAQQHLFEPFFTTKEQGRGLGLAMVYGIVRGHGGTIHVYSELGQGSTFKVYLPVASHPAEGVAPEKAEAMGGIETVLVVDDEEPVRALLQRILEEGGYTVLLARDGIEAMELYAERSTEIDLVVLDIIMPRMGGRKTYERLREINPEVKVLLTSGYSEEGQAQDILAAGARGFLQKPYDLHAVLAKVREVL